MTNPYLRVLPFPAFGLLRSGSLDDEVVFAIGFELFPKCPISEAHGGIPDASTGDPNRGLVSSRREGQRVYYQITSPKITHALDLRLEVMKERTRIPTK
jgi:hypothetical protein